MTKIHQPKPEEGEMKTIKRAVYHCLWAVSVWADAKSMEILLDLSANDPMFIDGRYQNEMTLRLVAGHSHGVVQEMSQK